jgi:hypothetical protein
MSPENAIKCHAFMLKHLREKCGEDFTADDIIGELPAMHQGLLDQELIPSSFDFLQFRQIALFQKQAEEIFSAMVVGPIGL